MIPFSKMHHDIMRLFLTRVFTRIGVTVSFCIFSLNTFQVCVIYIHQKHLTMNAVSHSLLVIIFAIVTLERKKIHPCESDVISEPEHRSLCGRNETRTVNLEEQSEKSARAQSERTENPVGDTAGSMRRTTGMETFHKYSALIT